MIGKTGLLGGMSGCFGAKPWGFAQIQPPNSFHLSFLPHEESPVSDSLIHRQHPNCLFRLPKPQPLPLTLAESEYIFFFAPSLSDPPTKSKVAPQWYIGKSYIKRKVICSTVHHFRCVHASLKEGLFFRPSVRRFVTRFFQ